MARNIDYEKIARRAYNVGVRVARKEWLKTHPKGTEMQCSYDDRPREIQLGIIAFVKEAHRLLKYK